MKKWVIIGVVIVGAALGLVISVLNFTATGYKWHLERALRKADRIELQTTGSTSESPWETLAELNGRSEVDAFLKMVEIDDVPNPSDAACKCDGDCLMVFYIGEARVCRIGIYHGRRLGWYGRRWRRMAVLTEKSDERIRDWLISHGINELPPGE